VSASPVVLVVEHQATCPPAWFGDWLQRLGVTLEVRRPYQGDALPASPTGLDGLLVMGGSMGAHDTGKHPWLSPTQELLVRAAERDLPTLGICLGHQLAVSALGGSVEVNPRGQQIGVLPVDWLPAAADDPLFGRVSKAAAVAVYWNHDLVTRVPETGDVLARADSGEIQALRLGERLWGVQFHPEVSPSLARTWADEEQSMVARPELDEVVEAVRVHESTLRETWGALASSFATLVCAQ
jgi:GMP synthase (glutamine-hydrolysing)